MWCRKRLDIGWTDLFAGMAGCCRFRGREAAQRQLEQFWSAEEDGFCCLSVRSGFDLYWKVENLPVGSEVLISALTIPDMVRILKEHGLVPVPLDLDDNHPAPTPEMLSRAVTPKTKAVVVAHLFGIRIPLEPLIAEARRHNLLVLEDCAQAYAGPEFRGHSAADVSMFSFGTIKTATAVSGGLFRVADRDVLQKMSEEQNFYPVQTGRRFFYKLFKTAVLKGLSSRYVFGLLISLCRILGIDYDRMFNSAVKGFPGPELFGRLRQQPCASLLRLLFRRIKKFNSKRLAERTRKGELLVELLADRVICPTARCSPNSHWVFPVVSQDPRQTIALLAQAGFDSTQGRSMCVVDPPQDRPECEPHKARELLEKIVFLPLYPELPDAELRRMAEVILNDSACQRDASGDLREISDSQPQIPAGEVAGRKF